MRATGIAAPRAACVTRRVLLLLALAALAFAGCEDKAETADEEAAAERPDVDAERTIRVELRHPPDEAFKDAIYRVTFRPGEGYDVEPKLLEPLLKAASQDLVASDGLKSCRYSQNLPRFEIFIPAQQEGDSELHLISSSHCHNWAPWNVVVDGKLHVQLSGAVGEALKPLLVELDSPRFEHARWPREGRFELTESVAELPEGVEAQAAPWLGLADALVADPAFVATFGEDVSVEGFQVLCSQTVSADCSELLGQARVPWRDKFVLELGSTLALDKVISIDMPESSDEFDRLLGSKLFAAFEKSAGKAPITLAYDKRGDCRNLEHGAAQLRPDSEVSTLSCEYYSALVEHYEGATTLPPQLFYFPALEAARLNNWADKTELGFFKTLGAPDNIQETILLDKVRFFAALDGTLHQIDKE